MSMMFDGKQLYTLAEVSKTLGYTYEELFEMMKEDDDIDHVNIGGLMYVDINGFIKTCIVCGKPIKKNRTFFCSRDCNDNSKKSLKNEVKHGKEKEKLNKA